VDSPDPLRGHTTGCRWTRHGRSVRTMVGGLEMCVPDGADARSLAGFGWESFPWVRYTWVPGWGLPLESIPGSTHDGKFDYELRPSAYTTPVESIWRSPFIQTDSPSRLHRTDNHILVFCIVLALSIYNEHVTLL
jgi:hypothetical protein